MARFYGEVGYGDTVETPPNSGVWKSVITEATYSGDVIRNTRRLEEGEGLNTNITVANSISVVADEYAIQNFFKIKYIIWMGVYWTVTKVEVQHPRLVLSLGEVYNGPKA